MPHTINADDHEAHAAAASSSGDALKYLLLALRYAGTLAAVLAAIAGGNLDQMVKGIRIGGDTWDLEVKATKRTALPSPPA